MRERYPFSEDVVCHPGKWTTMERGIQYLRELAMQEMVYYDPDNVQLLTDPDEVQCTRLVWWTFVQSTPPAYVKSLAVLAWKDEEAPTVNEVAGQLQQYEENLSSSLRACVSAVERLSEKSKNFFEKLSQEFWQLKEDTSNSPLVWTSISAVRKALCILGIDYLMRLYFKDPKGYQWAFGIAALEMEEIKQLFTLPGLLEDPSVVGLLRVEEQQVPIATTMVHWWQYRSNCDSLIPIHKLIRQLEIQGMISRTCSPLYQSHMSSVEVQWRLTADYRGLNEFTLLLSAAARPDMLELQYELESKAAKWYATIDIANAFFSIPLAAECRPQFALTWRGVQYTWNRLPQGWKHSPTICHGLIQTALEKGEAPEHLQYIDAIIVWGNTAAEVSEKGKKIVQILLKARDLHRRSSF
ncbi:hypothetical protein GRJ2_003488400 [Grus japonensis]|uniref:ribonuclease H n=1 Tax=Grus japonensis TaxID=30415 RepID=A0ABC9YKL8_GRUJA